MTGKSIHPKFRRRERLASVVRTLGVLAIAAVAALGCAKAQTLILTEISVDSTVPPLLILQYAVARASDPTHPATTSVVSLAPGDAADRRGPFTFPMILSMGPFPGWSGTVEITLDGRDYFDNRIVASGTTTAQIVPEQQTRAALMLTAVGDPGSTDGGVGGDARDASGDDAVTDAATGS